MEKWDFLDQYWRLLYHFGFEFVANRRVPGSLHDYLSGFEIELPPPLGPFVAKSDIAQKCHALRDALELAFLVSQVDGRAFIEKCRGARELNLQLLSDEDVIPCRVDIGSPSSMFASYPEFRPWLLVALPILLTPLQQRDPKFEAVRQRVLAMAPATQRSKLQRELQIRLGVCFNNTLHPATVPSDLKRLLDGKQDGGTTRTGADPLPRHGECVFRYFVPSVSTSLMNKSFCVHLAAFMCDPNNRRVLELERIELDEIGSCSPVIDRYGELLTLLLLRLAIEPNADATQSGSLSLLCQCRREQLPSQLWSTVMVARGVASLSVCCNLGEPRQDPRSFLQWMTLALFSNWVSHTIQHVDLWGFCVTEDECEQLHQLCQCASPLAALARGTVEDDTPLSRTQVFVAKDTKLELRVPEPGQYHAIKLEASTWFDVMLDDPSDNEHLCVLVPAYGACHMRRRDVVNQRPHDRVDRRLSLNQHGIQSLELRAGDAGREGLSLEIHHGLTRFLGLIGAPLQMLSIAHVDKFAQCVESGVLWSCPLLTHLNITDTSSDILAALVDAYETGACRRVASLGLPLIRVAHGSQDAVRFFDALADPGRKIAKTLRNLVFGVKRPRADRYTTLASASRITQEEAAAMTAMLEANDTLAMLRIVQRAWHNESWAIEVCVAFHDQPLPGEKVSLDCTIKCAFLSVAGFGAIKKTPTNAVKVHHVIAQLGSDVIKCIFKLAAQPITRTVVIGSPVGRGWLKRYNAL